MCSRLNAELPRLRARLPELTLPLLAMHGSADRLAPESGTRRLFEGASSQDKTLRIYPGLYHEVHNEPEQGRVLADVLAWLEARA
jgi:alpha-beta hydrolase superfamily lysophospholipase